jgi:hypothetical protein
MYHLVPYHGTVEQLSTLLSSGSDIFYATTETKQQAHLRHWGGRSDRIIEYTVAEPCQIQPTKHGL